MNHVRSEVRTQKRKVNRVEADPAMPWLQEALDPEHAAQVLGDHLPYLHGVPVRVEEAEVLKRNPGRRAVVAYQLKIVGGHPDSSSSLEGPLRIVGKSRARGLDHRTLKLHHLLADRGFGPRTRDGISVPPPLGTVAGWNMWFQQRVPGETLERLIPSLEATEGRALMRRVVGAIGKLHRAEAPTERTHTLEDELRILEERLAPARAARPDLAALIGRVHAGCRQLATELKGRPHVGIHRDFYPAQLVLGAEGLHLLDLDLFARGDPTLDIGNFLAHLTEQSLRHTGDPESFAHLEDAVTEAVLHSEKGTAPVDVQIWHLLSLARHIGLSVSRAGRAHTTEPLVDLCAQELADRRALPPGGSTGRTSPARRVRARSAVLVAALIGFMAGGALPATAQVEHRVNAGVDLSSVYDSNINRDPENPEGLAGLVTTGILRYRARGDYDLRTEYEIGLHRYHDETRWNRVSHKARLDGRRQVGSRGTLGFVSEVQIRGSGEDRSLGNQLSIEPSFRFQFTSGTEIRLRGVSRIRRNKAPAEGETHRFTSAQITQEVGSETEVEVEFRLERNRSDGGRRDFGGPRVGVEVTRQLGSSDEVVVGLQYRERSYLSRWVETSAGEVRRHDTRLTPILEWEHKFGNLFRMSLEYEYDSRSSNDPDKILGGHTLVLGARILR